MAHEVALDRVAAKAATAAFVPPRWLRGPHAQTLYAFTRLKQPVPAWARERLELPDGDFVDLCHFGGGDGPRVCVFHGLEGRVQSHYIGGLIAALIATGHRVSFMHFRGCSGEPNRLPRAYHSGDTGDIGYLIDTLVAREPGTPLGAVGFSLGGNALLKYLGERGAAAPLQAAVAVSVPFDLDACARRIDQGFSRLYQAHLVRQMKASTRARAERLGGLGIYLSGLDRIRSFREFDHRVTAQLHGFDSGADYYARASSGPWLGSIVRPTRIIHARDDPFVGPEPVPGSGDVSRSVELDISAHGGHVGFIAAGRRGRPYRWLDGRIAGWLAAQLRHG
ncbi:MAG: hydrolase [Halofilum sp. (in: g-proteobacteria)]